MLKVTLKTDSVCKQLLISFLSGDAAGGSQL